MSISPARLAALELLRKVESGGSDLGRALVDARAMVGDERDRSLAAELVIGTLRWRAVIDHVVERHATRPLSRLDAGVLRVLRLAAFQLLYLDRVPAAAVVNDAVQMTRAAGFSSAAGFVNAVLRQLVRAGRAVALPPPPGGSPDQRADAWASYLALTGSHPRWLVARWLDRWGLEATEAWLAFNNAQAPPTLRANRLVTTREDLARALADVGIETRPTAVAPDGLVVVSGRPLGTALAGSGQFVVQDEASQLVAEVAGVRVGERVLDACAAPGGKTLALAWKAGCGRVIACDLRPARVALLSRTLRAHRAGEVTVVRADLTAAPFRDGFDVVLLDAPCSGLGTLRRDPDIKWRRVEADLAGLADRQLALLRGAAGTVAAGGRLVYATCSSERDEDEAVVERFLDCDRRFALAGVDRLRGLVPAALHPLIEVPGWFRSLPHRDGLEAFFAAVLLRLA